jgi:prepilin-type N-terminal cleavage/methylation domain-containing protein
MRRRAGFTITELLVAMALIVFIMSILATAFSEGMKTFRGLKGIGDMNQRLRTVSSLLRADLEADHFEGRRRLSDTQFWVMGPPREGFFRIWQGSAPVPEPNPPIYANPVFQANPYYYYNEGSDIDSGIESVRATDQVLHFTVKKRGNDPKDFFHATVPATVSVPVPGTPSPLLTYGNPDARFQDLPTQGSPTFTFNSQWAEVAWFLRPNGQNANGTPLYTLYRRQRVLVPVPENAVPAKDLNFGPNPILAADYNDLTRGVNYLDMSCRIKNGSIYFNTPADVTVPQYRFSMQPTVNGGLPRPLGNGYQPYYIFQPAGTGDPREEQTNPNLTAADAVLTDVISFTVRISTGGNFIDVPRSRTATGNDPTHNPLFDKATGPFVFDTWTTVKDDVVDYSLWNYDYNNTSTTLPRMTDDQRAVRPPSKTIITAIQVQIRIWDQKTEQTRQMTLVVDM